VDVNSFVLKISCRFLTYYECTWSTYCI